MNLAYLKKAGRRREDLVGRYVFDAFPDNPADPGATGVANLAGSLQRVLATGESDLTELQKYDVEEPDNPGQFARRYWSQLNAPVLDADGQVILIAHCPEEVTDRLRRFMARLASGAAGEESP